MDKPLFRIVNRGGRYYLVHAYSAMRFSTGPERILPLEKPPSKTRLLFIGESSAGLSATATRRIIDSDPDLDRFEVLNCAVSGGSLVMVKSRFRECSQYSPDAAVLLFGHNLFFSLRPISSFSYWAFEVSRRSALLNRLATMLRDNYLVSSWSASDDPASRWRSLDKFIAQVAAFTQARHIPLILCTAPVNMWVPPYIPPDKKSGILYNPSYLEARYLYATGRREEAIKTLEDLVLDAPVAWWRWKLGAWLYRNGQYGEAAFFLSDARNLDQERDRASSAVNDVIRQSARRFGALVDADLMVRERSPHGISGWTSFIDCQHLNDPAFASLAASVLGDVNGGRAPRVHLPWEKRLSLTQQLEHPLVPFWQGDSVKSSRLWLTLSYVAQARLAEVLDRGESSAKDAAPAGIHRAIIFLAFAQACWRAGKKIQAFRFNADAARTAPGWEEPLIQRALFDLGSNRRSEAALLLRKALKINSARADAAYFLKRSAG
ncbi:MAG TPA: hypothetical protein VNK24_02935 [Elusimicrobiota bacterium]|nr:hypothetical protein [Elusimicrobiota bacterium]